MESSLHVVSVNKGRNILKGLHSISQSKRTKVNNVSKKIVLKARST